MKNNSQSLRKFILCLFCFFIVPVGNCQYWMFDAGSQLLDEAMDVSRDGSGNFYTTGYFGGTADFSSSTLLSTSGASDIFLMKTNPSGQLIWAVKAGGFGEDRGLSVKTDNAGNSYVTGFFYGTATFSTQTITSAGGLDVFVAKYNNAGILQWVVSAGGSGSDVSNAVDIDPGGNVIITGQFFGAATFGSTVITSPINPQNGQYYGNIFIAMYSNNGNFLWVKQGVSDKDCRGMNIAADAAGNIFLTGEFSDTLTFDQAHNNNMYNAIFLVKFDSAGNELWFKKAGGSLLNIAYGITTDNNQDVIITGEASGQLMFFGSTNFILTNQYPHQAFLAKFKNQNGDLLWAVSDGSDSEVSSRVVCSDNSGNLFITGIFTCKFSEYADTLGQGTFNSIGYRDIFVAKYNSSGSRIWMRNFGGKNEDYVHGMVLANNMPVLAGSFINALVVPYQTTTVISTNHQAGSFYFPVNTNNNFCNDNSYDDFFPMLSYGSSDIFLVNVINLNRQPYDYYCRDGGMAPCDRSYVGCCIIMTGHDYCTGNGMNEACGAANLTAASNTSSWYSSSYSCGPNFTYLWSDASINRTTTVNASGNYSVTVTSEDGCFQSSDTFDVIIHPLPQTPWISDNLGFGTNSDEPYTISVCADSVILTGSNTNGCTYHWSGQGIPGITGDSVITLYNGLNDGDYTFIITDSLGCSKSNYVWVDFNQPFEPVDPYLLSYLNTIENDTIYICEDSPVNIHAYDSITDPLYTIPCNPVLDPVLGLVLWNITPAVQHYSTCVENMLFFPPVSGLYQINYTLIRQNLCDTDTFIAHNSFYVIIRPNPTVDISITGTQYICPGDTTILTACCASNYHWPGTGFTGDPANDSITVYQPGSFTVSGTDTNQYGCMASGYDWFNVSNWPMPGIVMNPSNGLICPGGYVSLSSSGAVSYEWYGPSGLLPSNSSGVQVSVAGYYFCIATYPDSCRVSSNTVEVKQYATPTIISAPYEVICQGESVMLSVVTNSGSDFHWLPPLSGSNPSEVVSNPGIYSCEVTSCGITTLASIEIGQSLMSLNITPDTAICSGDTVSLHVYNLIPENNLIYLWEPLSEIISGESTGHPVICPDSTISFVIFTQNQYQCESTDTITVYVDNATALVTGSGDVTCNGICNGTAIASGTGILPLQYHWSNNGNSPEVSGLCAGYITLTVTDSIGCHDTASVLIIEPDQLVATTQSFSSYGCDSNCTGMITVSSSGGIPPYVYQWPESFYGDTLDFLCKGYYSVTVSDANNCQIVLQTFVDDTTDLSASLLSVSEISCRNLCDGSITTVTNGGVAPYQYAWNTGQAAQMIDSLCPGVYVVTVTDAESCEKIVFFNVVNPMAVNSVITASPPVKCHDDKTSLTANVYYGTPPYSFQWNDSLHQTSQTINEISAGVFVVTVTDSHNCLDSAVISISNPPLPEIVASIVNAACSASCNGSITIYITGMTYPYSAVWSDGSDEISRQKLCQGGYSVTLTDNNGCQAYRQFHISSTGYTPSVHATSDEIELYRGSSTHLHATGPAGASYTWSPSQWLDDVHSENPVTTPRNTVLYQLWVTDSMGCRNYDTITIFVKDVFCSEPYIYVPNAFTPNNDGNNDILYAYTNMAVELYFVIYDRWGEIVFESTSLRQGWDGTYKGKELTSAVFIYYLKVVCRNNEIFEKKGNVTLIR